MKNDLTWKLKAQPTAGELAELVKMKVLTADEARDIIFNKGKRENPSTATTVVHFLLDGSGSMGSVRDATIEAYNEYVNSLKKDGGKYKLSLTSFDSDGQGKLRLNEVHEHTYVDELPELTREDYVPAGGTPLYDAFCSVLKRLASRKDEKHLFVVLTDGQENASSKYTAEDMKKLKAEKEEDGNWTFVYLGANQDSFATSKSFGFSHSNTSNFNATDGGIKTMVSNLSFATRSYSASPTMSTSAYFTKDMQDENEQTK